MIEEQNIKNSVISFLNTKNSENEKNIEKFLCNFDQASKINDLIEVIDSLEQENYEDMNQVILMSKDINNYFQSPICQISVSSNDLERNPNSFQDSLIQFDESYNFISEKLLPLIIIERNIDLAKNLYQNLQISIEKMDEFADMFCGNEPNQELLENAIKYPLAHILVCFDIFQGSTNSDALDIFNSKLEKWVLRISHTLKVERNSLINYIPFFDKFDQEAYKEAKKIKELILYKFYDTEFDRLSQYKNDIKLLTDKKRCEQFIYDFFSFFVQVMNSASGRFPNIDVPDSFNEGLIHNFENIFRDIFKFIDVNLHSEVKYSFTFQNFNRLIHEHLTNKKVEKVFIDKINPIIRLIEEKCSNELIQQWEIKIKNTIQNAFTHYQNAPLDIFNFTQRHVTSYENNKKADSNINKKKGKKTDSDTVSKAVYSSFQGKYIMHEVFEIIFNFETDYDHKLCEINEEKAASFTELLINQSNSIIKHLNKLDFSTFPRHKRSSALIIANTYHALSKIVKVFRSQRYNSITKFLPLTRLFDYHLSCIHLFVSGKSLEHMTFSSRNDEFYQYIRQYLATDELKKIFIILYTEFTVNSFAKEIYKKKSVNLEKNKKRLQLIYESAAQTINDTADVKILIDRASVFFENPQNGTASDFIGTCRMVNKSNEIRNNEGICKHIEANLLKINM